MKPHTIAADKANHYAYGSLAATCGAVAVFSLVMILAQGPMAPRTVLALITAAVGAGISAWLLGEAKEEADARANERAISAGRPSPHEVSRADVKATALGAVPVGMFCLSAAVTLLLVMP